MLVSKTSNVKNNYVIQLQNGNIIPNKSGKISRFNFVRFFNNSFNEVK